MPTRAPAGPVLTAPVGRALLAGLSLLAVVIGITLPGPLGSGWDAFLAWSLFASACVLAVLAGGATEHRFWSWAPQLYGTAGLLLFWLIAVRPIAAGNAGFLITFGVVLAVLSTWRNPWRPPTRQWFGRPRGVQLNGAPGPYPSSPRRGS